MLFHKCHWKQPQYVIDLLLTGLFSIWLYVLKLGDLREREQFSLYSIWSYMFMEKRGIMEGILVSRMFGTFFVFHLTVHWIITSNYYLPNTTFLLQWATFSSVNICSSQDIKYWISSLLPVLPSCLWFFISSFYDNDQV